MFQTRLHSYQCSWFCSSQVDALRTMAVQGGPTYNLSQQPWAQPGESWTQMFHDHKSVSFVFYNSDFQYFPFFHSAKINDVVMATYRILKNKLPGTLQSMSLYLANRDTEFILFKPVRVSNISWFLWCHRHVTENNDVNFSTRSVRTTSSRFFSDCMPYCRKSTAERTCRSSHVLQWNRCSSAR